MLWCGTALIQRGLMIDNGRGRAEQNSGEERGVTWKDCIRAISLC